MPLPSVSEYGAKQCTALNRQTKQQCKNPAAFGCKVCRYHGARRKESIRRGEQHPNYVHGKFTFEAKKKSSEKIAQLQMIEDAMHLLGMTTAKRSRGRKALRYSPITLVDEIKKVIE